MTKTSFKLNLGPQHPSTHGVLRLLLELKGEKIISCEPDVGYLHRGMEKMAEKLSYIQYLPLVDRIDYLAGFSYSELFCRTVEKALNIELSDKVRAIRVMLLELNRISSHLLWLGAFLLDLGATSPFFYAIREREMILRFFEKLTGQRMMYNYFVFGGVRQDIDFLDDVGIADRDDTSCSFKKFHVDLFCQSANCCSGVFTLDRKSAAQEYFVVKVS